MTTRIRVQVSGKVQGVWFRESARQQAERLGVTGWIRNLPDGRVEAVVEGEDAAVAQMQAWLQQGPPAARVEDVQLDEQAAEGLQGFEVRR